MDEDGNPPAETLSNRTVPPSSWCVSTPFEIEVFTDDPAGVRPVQVCGYQDRRHHGYRGPAPDSLDWQKPSRLDSRRCSLLRRLFNEGYAWSA